MAKLSHLHLRLGRLAKARSSVESALALCERLDLTSVKGQVLERQGLLLFLEESFEKAEQTFDQSLELHRKNQDHLWQGFSHCHRGEVRMHRGRTSLARADFKRALAFQQEVGDQRLMGVVDYTMITPCGSQIITDFFYADGDLSQVDISCLETFDIPFE